MFQQLLNSLVPNSRIYPRDVFFVNNDVLHLFKSLIISYSHMDLAR